MKLKFFFKQFTIYYFNFSILFKYLQIIMQRYISVCEAIQKKVALHCSKQKNGRKNANPYVQKYSFLCVLGVSRNKSNRILCQGTKTKQNCKRLCIFINCKQWQFFFFQKKIKIIEKSNQQTESEEFCTTTNN